MKDNPQVYDTPTVMRFVVEELAWVMFSIQRQQVTLEILHHSIATTDQYEIPKIGELRQRFALCFFINQKDDEFVFQHSSLREYFLARAIFRRIRDDHPAHVGVDVWEPPILELLAELESELVHLKQAESESQTESNLLKWVHLTRSSRWNAAETGPYIASNAISLLHKLGEPLVSSPLDNARLPSASLAGATLADGSLAGVDLSKADLRNANLKAANLAGANLTRADLRGAILTAANLTGADLSYAKIDGAYLGKANLSEANLTGTDIETAISTAGIILDRPIWRDARHAEGLCRQAVASGDYETGRRELVRFVESFLDRAAVIRREFEFVFDLDATADEDAARWDKQRQVIDPRRNLWQVVCRENRFFGQDDTSDEATTTPEQLAVAVSHNAVPADATTVLTKSDDVVSDSKTAEQIGEELEQAVMKLFRKLFVIGEADEKTFLSELRQQNRTLQFGHDVSLVWSVQNHDTVRCRVECKNYDAKIKLDDIAGKLVTMKALVSQGEEHIDHWILISPRSNVKNDVKLMLELWEQKEEYPFKIHVWTPETLAPRFFGLVPELYDEFRFSPAEGDIHPREWTQARRETEVLRLLKSLEPPLRIPSGFKDYVQKENGLILKSEPEGEFKVLLKNQMPLRAANENNVIDWLDDSVRKWLQLAADENPILVLLGEFGDGKSAFTYLLARALRTEFRRNPRGWLPIRFALRDFEFAAARDPQEFLRRRLVQLGAQISEWLKIRSDFHVLVILDGFDEMSIRMDPTTVRSNINTLEKCCREEFRGSTTKILLTSRTGHFLQNKFNRTVLCQELGSPQILFLRGFSREQVREGLRRTCEPENHAKLERVLELHDLVGLASKPLFFVMIQSTYARMPDEDINEVGLYEQFARNCLTRKKEETKSETQDVLLDHRIDNMLKILEEVALRLHKAENKQEFVFLRNVGEDEQKEYAQELWEMVEHEDREEADATARVGARSLLRRIETDAESDAEGEWPVSFCHRSMKEYFVARRIVRQLAEAEDDVSACRNLTDLTLGREIIHFAALMMKLAKEQRYSGVRQKYLLRFIHQTKAAHEQQLSEADRAGEARLGSNSISLLYAWKDEVPSDLNGCILDGAELAGVDLFEKTLCGTSLRDVRFDNANFRNANFTNADLTGVRLEQTAEPRFLSSPDPDGFYAAYQGGEVRYWPCMKAGDHRIVYAGRQAYFSGCASYPGNNLCLFGEQTLSFHDYRLTGEFASAGEFEIDPTLEAIRIRGNMLVCLQRTSDTNKRAHLVDLTTAEIIHRFDVGDAIFCDNLGIEGLIYYDTELRIVLFEASGNKPREYVFPGVHEPTCVAVIEDGAPPKSGYVVACGQRDGFVKTWRVTVQPDWNIVPQVNARLHTDIVSVVTFLDEQVLLSGGNDRRIIRSRLAADFSEPVDQQHYALRIECAGMKIDGVKGEKERRLLQKLLDESTK